MFFRFVRCQNKMCPLGHIMERKTMCGVWALNYFFFDNHCHSTCSVIGAITLELKKSFGFISRDDEMDKQFLCISESQRNRVTKNSNAEIIQQHEQIFFAFQI